MSLGKRRGRESRKGGGAEGGGGEKDRGEASLALFGNGPDRIAVSRNEVDE